MTDAALRVAALAIGLSCGPFAGPASGQIQDAPAEDIEPRIVGKRGTTSIGLAGFADRFFSPEEVLSASYTVQVDGARFFTERFAFRLGVAGTGTFGGDSAGDARAGAGAPAVHGMGGVLFYFTPRSLLSAYLGSEYWLQITSRAAGERGSVLGKAGIHATLSSRASVFVEAGAGTAVSRGSEGELLTRFVGQIGLRIKL